MKPRRNSILFTRFASLFTCMASILLLSSFSWPDAAQVITEFASLESPLNFTRPAPFLALQADGGYETSDDGTLIYDGKLHNGLGRIQARADSRGFVQLYGNLESVTNSIPDSQSEGSDELIRTEVAPDWNGGRKPLILMLFDQRRRLVVNPEIYLDNPPGNEPPSLIRLVFTPLISSPEDGLSSGDVNRRRANSEPVELWSWYRSADIQNGNYLLAMDVADGRFQWDDVRDIFSIKLYVNGQLQFQQGLVYLAEKNGRIRLSPGISGDAQALPVSLRPGMNVLEVYLEDAKGLSAAYEFTINGGAPGAQ